jgi:hypothetical protein
MGHECEISGCGEACVGTMNGVCVCERCRQEFVSVGHGAVFFDGRWHGVVGSRYTRADVAAYPGLLTSRPVEAV